MDPKHVSKHASTEVGPGANEGKHGEPGSGAGQTCIVGPCQKDDHTNLARQTWVPGLNRLTKAELDELPEVLK